MKKIAKLREALLARIAKSDHYEFFQHEVNGEDVPDYRKYIKKPMAYATIREQLTAGEFDGDAEDAVQPSRFAAAMLLVCENAMVCASSSSPHPPYYATMPSHACTPPLRCLHSRARIRFRPQTTMMSRRTIVRQSV